MNGASAPAIYSHHLVIPSGFSREESALLPEASSIQTLVPTWAYRQLPGSTRCNIQDLNVWILMVPLA